MKSFCEKKTVLKLKKYRRYIIAYFDTMRKLFYFLAKMKFMLNEQADRVCKTFIPPPPLSRNNKYFMCTLYSTVLSSKIVFK
jgi:hypothetical protein